uniref:Uncharacterized protein n=1 Tax=Ciona savignyi TaxID=51511 RepID=H2YCL7_CIOSA
MQGSGAVKPSPKSEEVCYMAPTSIPVFQDSKSISEKEKSPKIEEVVYNGPKSDSVTYMSPKSQVLSNDSDPYMFKMVDMSEFRTSPSKTTVEYSTPKTFK